MILDSHGRPMTRRIGFAGGMTPERTPRSRDLASAVGFNIALDDEDDDEEPTIPPLPWLGPKENGKA